MAGVNKVDIRLVTTQFNKMIAELASIDAGVEFSEVVLEVSRAVVQNAYRRTTMASKASIYSNAATRVYTSFNGKKYNLYNRYPDELWSKIVAFRESRIKTKLDARGLARQSWWHLANMFDRPIKATAEVIRANYKGRKYPGDVSASQRGTGTSYQLTIKNNSPLVGHANMPNALKFAMHGQTQRFRTLLQKHAFKTVASRAAEYPGIFVSPRN